MMKLKLIFILTIFIIGCNSSLQNISDREYVSSCYTQRFPDLILNLETDNTFKYKFAYLEENVTGVWERKKDTLFLKSDYFSPQYQKPLTPSYKYSDFSNSIDAFIIKKNKLYSLDSLGDMRQDCFLTFR